MAQASTNGITVSVESFYLEERSQPQNDFYVFAYQITIANEGDKPYQLISRHWIITDANAKVEEVKGLGVVGEQPWIYPGEAYQYSSGSHLKTPVGTMQGTYFMNNTDNQTLPVAIPIFRLSAITDFN